MVVVVGRGVNVPLTMTAPILVIRFVTDPLRKHRGCIGLIGVEKNPAIHPSDPLYFRNGSVTNPKIDLFHRRLSHPYLDPIFVHFNLIYLTFLL